jgi:prepilin signal peptidase PulO-like enzyme (type II secretory pathway)
MIVAYALRERQAGFWLIGVGLFGAAAAHAIHMPAPTQLFMALALAGAALNVVVSEQLTDDVPDRDIVLLLGVTLVAACIASPQPGVEIMQAAARIAVFGGSATLLAWAYWRIRGSSAASDADIKVIAALGAMLPLAIAIYATALATTLTLSTLALMYLWRGETLHLSDRIPIASILTGVFYLAWLACYFGGSFGA